MHRSILLTVAALTLGLVASPASASPSGVGILAKPRQSASARKNIAIGRIDGPKSSKIRLALMQRLKESPSFTVTDAEDLKAGSGKGAIAKMAKALQVDAVMLGTVTQGNDLSVSIYKPDGRLFDKIKVKGGTTSKLESAIQNEFDVTIAPPLADASGAKLVATGAAPPAVEEEEEPEAAEPPVAAEPAEEPSPEGGEDTPPAEEKKDEDDAKGAASKPGRTPFELSLGLRGYSRAWDYTDARGPRNPALRRTLRPYRLAFAPSLMFNGILYPAAFFTDNALANIGLMGGAETGIATTTDYEQQQVDGSKVVTTLKTSSQAWDIGLRGRIPLGPAEISLFVEYGSQSFILRGDEGGSALSPLVPDVKYNYVRIGLEPRARFGKFSMGAHFAPRILTSLHQIDLEEVWFPGAHGRGLDFGLMFGYAVLPFMDAVVGADFVGYGFDFNPLPEDPVKAPVVAGGATDYYRSLWLAARIHLGGSKPAE